MKKPSKTTKAIGTIHPSEHQASLFFEWTDELSVGIPKIDVQHRTLIGFINSAYRGLETPISKTELKQILENLIDYSRVHFAYEEKLFSESHYPESKEHQKEHLVYCNTILDYYDKFLSGQAGVLSQICIYLKNWLFHHIMVSDKNYSRFILTYLSSKKA